MKRNLLLAFIGLALLTAGVLVVPGCAAKNSREAAKPKFIYRCAMHPQVTSDKPGLCPICNMQLNKELIEAPSAPSAPSALSIPAADAKASPKRWRSPMNPNEIYDHPGKDSMGMDFIPIEESPEGASAGTVKLSPERQQLIGIQTAQVKAEPFGRTLRASARLAADETKLARVQVKVSGTVERLYADFIGKPVRRGEPLLSIYSPDLYATQQDYLNVYRARQSAGASLLPEVRQGSQALLDASRQRLRLWGVTPGEIGRLEKTGQARKNITLVSPVSGVITAKNVYPGMNITPDMELYQVADLATLWVLADFQPADLAELRVGQPAIIILENRVGPPLTGKISFIQPVLNPVTRTVTVRIALPNRDRALLPDMLARVEISAGEGSRLAVPESAVVMSGTRSLVYLRKSPGEFTPVEVTTGASGNGRIEITSGLRAGDTVVIEANFLMDSESRIRAAASPSPQTPVAPVPGAAASPGIPQ